MILPCTYQKYPKRLVVNILKVAFNGLVSMIKHDDCEEPRLGLNQLNDGTDKRRVPLQDEDHPGNHHHLVPGFPTLCFGKFPERFRSASVSVVSREIRVI